MRKTGIKHLGIERERNKADWILLDYVDFVVHIFIDESRSYYNLERLWAEAPHIQLPEMNTISTIDEPEVHDEDEVVLGLVSAEDAGQS